ncbi:MAG TPA: redoxin domain-containing protein, partial [Planctomycetes bacterium]|nr:redoxin domain-containing protein [Planctomycetota bacterium]
EEGIKKWLPKVNRTHEPGGKSIPLSLQAKFKKDQNLGFHLLSDPDGSVAKKFGVLMKGRPYAKRVTFLIDEKGIVRHMTKKVDIAQHGDQVLKLIAKLRG